MLIEPIAPRFMCRQCDDQSFVITGTVADRSIVCCGHCRSELGEWANFVAESTATLKRLGIWDQERARYVRSDGTRRRVSHRTSSRALIDKHT